MFDFNNDGKIDFGEALLGLGWFNELTNSKIDQEEEMINATGYDCSDLEFMDEGERNVIFEDAGLDPMDYDF